MPITFPSSSTTGTAPISVLARRSMAVRASSSALTLGTSEFKMSAAVFTQARLFDRPVGAQRRRDRGDHVGGDHRLGEADPLRCLPPGASVGQNGGAGGGERLEAGAQQPRRHPGEDVAAAGGGE